MSGGRGKPASIEGIGPATHSQPGGPSSGQVGPVDHPAHGPDPALASWAQFSLAIGVTPLRGAGGFYDGRTHKHNPRYIRPPTYSLSVTAKPGLDANHKSGPRIPDNLVAFSWTVIAHHSGFHETQIVQRPIKPMETAIIELPARSDTYELRLRVAFADGRFAERTVEFDVKDWLIVSLGDSSASGQGNPDVAGSLGIGGGTVCDHPTASMMFGVTPNTNNDAEWVERKAYRSLRSVPAVAALSLADTSATTSVSLPRQTERFSFDRVTFASFARSGAEVLHGLIDPQGGSGDFIGAGQVEECRRTVGVRRIDALMINIGGNDAGFSGVLTDLVKKDTIWTGSLTGTLKRLALSAIEGPPGDDKLGRDQVEKRLSALLGIGLPKGQKGPLEVHYDMLHALVQDLQKSPGVGQVYITGYPVGLFDTRAADGTVGFRSCEIFDGPDMDITGADAKMIKRHGKHLNELIARKAAEFGWIYVDVEKEFEGHGYCSQKPFWRTAKLSCHLQGDFEGTMHPNEDGVRAWAKKYASAIREHTLSTRATDPNLLQ